MPAPKVRVRCDPIGVSYGSPLGADSPVEGPRAASKLHSAIGQNCIVYIFSSLLLYKRDLRPNRAVVQRIFFRGRWGRFEVLSTCSHAIVSSRGGHDASWTAEVLTRSQSERIVLVTEL
jgi:hypothetical protein